MSNTRLVSLWLDNEESLYREVQSAAETALENACENETHATTARNEAVEELAVTLEEIVCRSMPCEKGLWGDLITSALQSVDFEDIARDALADLQIWGLYSSDSEDAQLFTSADAAREHLMAMCPESVDPEGEISSRIEEMQPGATVCIEGTEYTLAVS